MNNIVARVIYSEASPICSYEERFFVASVIKNRIVHKGFDNGKLKTMENVVLQPKQFSCVNDVNNSNWEASFDGEPNLAWSQSVELSSGKFVAYGGIVYYHDFSISVPKCWNNKFWTPVKERSTEHFVFYTIKEKK